MAKILVIDDDDRCRAFIVGLLRRGRYEVVEAADGAQGLSLMRAHPFDAIVTDLVMPEKEGLDTICEARRHNPAIKIIAVSGTSYDDGMHLDSARRLGADLALAKPFTPESLLDGLRTLIS